jgi:hypothetical protein
MPKTNGKKKRKPRIPWARYRDRVVWLGKKLRREVTSKDVLKDAHDHKSPYHGYFTWDDRAAAQKQRLNEARHLLASIKIIYHDQMGNEVKVREYVRLVLESPATHELRGGYVPRVRAIKNHDLHRQMVEQAIENLVTYKRRFLGFHHVACSYPYVDGALKALRATKFRKVRKAR